MPLDADVTFVLLAVAVVALLGEAANPGVGVSGLTGVACLGAAVWSAVEQSANLVALALVLPAAVLFGGEVFRPVVRGRAAVVGAILLVLAGVLGFRDADRGPVALPGVLLVALLAAVASVLIGRVASTTRGLPSRLTGRDALVGRSIVIAELDAAGTRGRARLDGAWWNVRTNSASLVVGANARVVDVDGLTLVVEQRDVS